MSVTVNTYPYANSTKSYSGPDAPNHTVLPMQTGIMNMRELCYSGLGLGQNPYTLEDLSASTNLSLELSENTVFG